jgi:hypothetical protein
LIGMEFRPSTNEREAYAKVREIFL